MPPFWTSIAVLSVVQGALVALPGAVTVPRFARMRGRRWALIPPLSVIGFVFVAREAERASAQGLTYLALGAVPALAALALGWLLWNSHPRRALFVAPLFALAWVDRGGLAGESAALVLSGLSCVALGVLLATVTPPRWLAAGVVAMALADSALVISDLLQKPNDVLNAARPVAGLPQLQTAVFGSALMGYGDLFIAGVLGGLLAATVGRRLQLRAARLTVALALMFDLLFFLVDELPATLPVACALILIVLTRRRRASPRGSVPALRSVASAGRSAARPPGAR